jgi:4-amino-4-deoxy-L-arabinose transferase-like glycosyltransferase
MELANQRQLVVKRAVAIAVLFIGAAAARIFWVDQTLALYGAEPFYTWLSSGVQISPLYAGVAAFLARTFEFFGLNAAQSLEYGSIFVYAVAGGLLVAPVYGIARRMSSEAVASGIGLAVAFYPVSLTVLPGAVAMTEPLYLLLVASAWYFLLRAVDENSLWLTGLGGLLIGFAYLARITALPYMAFALGLLLLATWRSRRDRFAGSRVLASALLALIAFAAVASPYVAALYGINL